MERIMVNYDIIIILDFQFGKSNKEAVNLTLLRILLQN